MERAQTVRDHLLNERRDEEIFVVVMKEVGGCGVYPVRPHAATQETVLEEGDAVKV